MKIQSVFAFLFALCMAWPGTGEGKVRNRRSNTGSSEGMPFGKIGESEYKGLVQFAKEHGLDLDAELKKAYGKDKRALSKIFKIAMKFNKMDLNARTYGQIIYSSLLSLGETMGCVTYAKVVASQEAAVRQRIRDFLYYSLIGVQKKKSETTDKNVRKDECTEHLFPKDYEFGHNDSLLMTI